MSDEKKSFTELINEIDSFANGIISGYAKVVLDTEKYSKKIALLNDEERRSSRIALIKTLLKTKAHNLKNATHENPAHKGSAVFIFIYETIELKKELQDLVGEELTKKAGIELKESFLATFIDECSNFQYSNDTLAFIFYIIKTMKEESLLNAKLTTEIHHQRPSVSKSSGSNDSWKPYKEKFNLLIAEGIEQSEAIKQIGNLIEEENTKRKTNNEKLIGTKGGNLTRKMGRAIAKPIEKHHAADDGFHCVLPILQSIIHFEHT